MTTEQVTTIDAERNPVVYIDGGEAVADSRDVAAFFGKDHRRVLQTIRELSCSPDFRRHNFVPFKNNDLTGEYTSHVMMTKDGFMFLAMGFTGGKAARLKEQFIAQFNAMEAELTRQAARSEFQVPSTLSEALRLAADQAETIEQQTALITDMTPKAEFHDDVSRAVNAQTFMQVAKFMKTGRTRFTKWLRERKFLMENNMPYQRYLDEGYFRVIEKKRKDPITGEPITYTQTLVTGKGATYLQRHWKADHLAEAS